MRKCCCCCLFMLLLAAGVAIWYQQLEDHQKMFIKNLLRQVPDLPGRFSI